MKKILIVLSLFLLTACAAKKEEFYNLKIGEREIVVGYDEDVTIKDLDYIERYTSLLNKKDKYILQSIEIYVDDVDEEMFINDISLNKGIDETCSLLNGEIINNNSKACVINAEIRNKNNTVIIYSNILDDNTDKVDRIVISYE